MDFLYQPTDIRSDIKQSMDQYIKAGRYIRTRFPPEPSGYLHIGHVKAIYINYGLSKLYNGSCVIRFDDTNPEKESMDYETNIIKDLNTLGIDTKYISHTSDFFQQILDLGEQLILSGDAYVDDTDAKILSSDRLNKISSKNRDNDIKLNVKLWKNMLDGSVENCCLRLKLDMFSNNGCLRDPVLCRNINKEHQHTGNKFKVYPTYDFACPIVDYLEGITHVIRSTEFTDRDEQYKCILDKFSRLNIFNKLYFPELFSYGKVDFVDTEMSKRKIKALIEEGKVIGWHDPRLPTVQGILGAGMSVQGLKEFAKSTGFSKNIISMSWDKIWGINRKIIDPQSIRIMCLSNDPDQTIRLEVLDQLSVETVEVPAYIKNTSLGNLVINRTQSILISTADYQLCEDGEEITLMNWGNMILNKQTNQLVKNLDGSVKATKNKIIWLPVDPNYLTLIELRKYIVPITDQAYTTSYMYTNKSTETVKDDSFVQIMKGDYVKKMNDNIFVMLRK